MTDPVESNDITPTEQTRVVKGIELPWDVTDKRWAEDWIARGKHTTGTVFVDQDTLMNLADQGVWDSQFGSVLLLDMLEGIALEQAGLAQQETRGGYHGTEKLKELLRRWGWV